MVASSSFALAGKLPVLSFSGPGLLLGSCLVLLVSAVSEEFSGGAGEEEGEYSYSWSFLAAVMACLAAMGSSLAAFKGKGQLSTVFS